MELTRDIFYLLGRAALAVPFGAFLAWAIVQTGGGLPHPVNFLGLVVPVEVGAYAIGALAALAGIFTEDIGPLGE